MLSGWDYLTPQADACTHLPRPEGWKAELSLNGKEDCTNIRISAEPGIEPGILWLEGINLTNHTPCLLLPTLYEFFNYKSLFFQKITIIFITIAAVIPLPPLNRRQHGSSVVKVREFECERLGFKSPTRLFNEFVLTDPMDFVNSQLVCLLPAGILKLGERNFNMKLNNPL